MGELLSCPFCRELFSEDEGERCPECDLPLLPLHQLPLSREGQAEAAALGIDPPQDQRLPLLYFGRGKGALLLTSLLGLALFFQPWMSMERPDPIGLSGYDLATSNAPWLWGGAVGWFISLPLVLSRRTVNQLRGVRVIAGLFASMSIGETLMLRLIPPETHQYFSVGLQFDWGLYASLAMGLLGLYLSAHLGGKLEDLRDLPVEVPEVSHSDASSLH